MTLRFGCNACIVFGRCDSYMNIAALEDRVLSVKKENTKETTLISTGYQSNDEKIMHWKPLRIMHI